jgi:N-acylneuraminate cytidylyltransferase
MIKNFNHLAIIPARFGSKRIPNKNIKNFNGKPIISYPILAAKKSKLFKEIIVSTDSNKIKKIVNKFGAKVYYLRSKKLSNDKAVINEVLFDIINFLKKNMLSSKYFCLLYATSPLINFYDLKKSLKILDASRAAVDSIIAVKEFSYPIQRALAINKHRHLYMKNKKYKNARSQDLEKLYHDAGVFVWFKTESFLNKIKSNNSFVSMPYVLEDLRVQDIDDIEDWKVAEFKYKYLQKKI